MPLLTFLIVLVVIVVVLAVTCVKIVPQAEAAIVERLGSYLTTWNNGLHIKVPFIDHVRMGISLKEQVFDFPPQPVITKDNVTISIDTVVFFKILDPKLFCYGVENPIVAIENLSATTIRNIIGELDLDTTLVSRDTINAKMRSILDEATDAWGIKVNRVEVKNITPPAAIQQAMEKQMKAEREKREAVLLAEGQKQSAITVAEGEKQAQILSAEAEKQAIILAAEAEKEKQIREAEGEAEAIRNVQRATAEGIAMVREAGADNAVLTLQAYEALKCVANGRATKLIIPSDIQGIAGLAASIKEIVTDDPKVASMRLRIHAMAQQIDSRLSIHDLRCVPGPTHTNVIFDCAVPAEYITEKQRRGAKLAAALRAAVERKWPDHFCIIKLEPDYSAGIHETK